MAESYYVRIRGRVTGPFEVSQLQDMIKRGRFSRIHEVSEDGAGWVAAAEVDDLFPRPAKRNSSPSPDDADLLEMTQVEAPKPELAEWYYTINDQRHGPIRLSQLRQLVTQGMVQPATQVWAQGMENWISASLVPDLTSFFSQLADNNNNSSPVTTESASVEDTQVQIAAAAPGGWLIFLVVFASILSMCLLVSGIWLTAQGYGNEDSSIVSQLSSRMQIQYGLICILFGGTLGFGTHLLHLLRASISDFSRGHGNLARVFQKLTGLAIYISILSIIYISITILAFTTAISLVGGNA